MSIAEIIAGPILKIIDKVLPDAGAKDAAKLKLLELAQAGELAELSATVEMSKAQNEVNKTEAASNSLFASSWRPAMGYCCVAIFASNYIFVPLLAWVAAFYPDIPAPPRLDIGEVMPVLLGMLGLGSLRTVERVKGSQP